MMSAFDPMAAGRPSGSEAPDGPAGRPWWRVSRWLPANPVSPSTAGGSSLASASWWRPGGPAPFRRWRLFGGIWLLFLIEPLREVLDQERMFKRVLGVLLLAGFAAVYLFLVPRARQTGSHRNAVPLTLGLITVGLGGLIGAPALGTLPFLLVTVALLTSTDLALAMTAFAAALIVAVPQYIPAWNVTGWQWARGASIGFAGLAAVGFTRLIQSNVELRAARDEVARLAAEGERARIARDMHDLLGHSLTTIAVKAELAQRIAGRDTERAEAEMTEVAGLARQALADVRAAVAGYREVSLAMELANAREVLAAAGISAEIPSAVDGVPPELRELFGWVVREGVTNVVRHSRARRVTINLEPYAIEIVNDGTPGSGGGPRGGAPISGSPVSGSPVFGGPLSDEPVSNDADSGEAADSTASRGKPAGTAAGHGLTGLAERAAAHGARVEAGPDPLHPNVFRLKVEVPPRAGQSFHRVARIAPSRSHQAADSSSSDASAGGAAS
jgi:two-component system, NarL family, sensor histidine kinase DesK